MRYDRTVIAYHGCDEAVARRLLRGDRFRPSAPAGRRARPLDLIAIDSRRQEGRLRSGARGRYTALMSSALAQESIRRLRRAEYEKLAGLGLFDDERVELLEGVITAMSPQGPEHQWSIVAATKYLVRLLGDRADVRVQLPFGATEDSEPEPDFAVVAPSSGLTGTPTSALLLIEISDSSLRRDRDVKAALYAGAGVPEYWIVDLARGVVEVRTRPDRGLYTRLDTLDRGATVRPVAFPELALDLAHFIPPPR